MESRDRLLLELRALQEGSGRNYLPPEGLAELRARFGLTKAELRGVASYYSLLSLEPRGRHLIRLCISPICRMLGSRDLLQLLSEELEIEVGGTSADGLFSLEESQCLGRCAGAPAMMVDDRVFERLTPESLRAILEHYRRGNPEALPSGAADEEANHA